MRRRKRGELLEEGGERKIIRSRAKSNINNREELAMEGQGDQRA